MKPVMERVVLLVIVYVSIPYQVHGYLNRSNVGPNGTSMGRTPIYNATSNLFVHTPSFPSEADTLAYVEALKHSNFSQWRSLEEVAKKAGGGSCSGAANTSILTSLYLLGLFNLCAASPLSCCIPPNTSDRRKRSNLREKELLPPILESLTQNLTILSLEDLSQLPHVSNAEGGRIPVHISIVEQVRKLWDSNPRLVSSVHCSTATESVRSSFISLSGVASGIILAYSIAQLNQCYPEKEQNTLGTPKIWLFPITNEHRTNNQHIVRSLPKEMPVSGEDDPDNGCNRVSVPMDSGQCAQLFSTNVCPYQHWVLLNRDTKKGECIPTLCSNGRVFVESDQQCHDVNEPGFCPPGQRLYLTAWGEAVCDCKDGSFPGSDGNCYLVYERAFCHKGTVLQFYLPSKTLACLKDQCQEFNEPLRNGNLPFAKDKQNDCHQLGTIGPCSEHERYGFDVDTLSTTCVSLKEHSLHSPRKSYTYSHISFPTESDFPHYEVSYVIVNGSTWELMMRTVGREKRDSRSQTESSVTFLDTRDFPTQMTKILPSFKEFGLVSEAESEQLSELSRGKTITNSSSQEFKMNKKRRFTTNKYRANNIKKRHHFSEATARGTTFKHKKKPRSLNKKRKQNKKRRRNKVPRCSKTVSSNYADIKKMFFPTQNDLHNNAKITSNSHLHINRNESNEDINGIILPPKTATTIEGNNIKKTQELLHIVQKKYPNKKIIQSEETLERHLHKAKGVFTVPQLQAKNNKRFSKRQRKRKRRRNRKKSRVNRKRFKKRSKKRRPDNSIFRTALRNNQTSNSSVYDKTLPDYLRNRGRRQVPPGIINAPLLTQCRPGAKRDYNGNCRPKIIPSDKSPPPRVNAAQYKPSAPMLKCKDNARLDSKGVCKEIFRGLG